jgi:hypothetical protein
VSYGQFVHTPAKVEGRVASEGRGGSSPLGRMKKALHRQGFYFFVSSTYVWRAFMELQPEGVLEGAFNFRLSSSVHGC